MTKKLEKILALSGALAVASALALPAAAQVDLSNFVQLGDSYTAGFQDGWVKITGTAGLTGFAAYGDTIGGAIAVVPTASAKSNLLFAHIADGPAITVPWPSTTRAASGTRAPASIRMTAPGCASPTCSRRSS